MNCGEILNLLHAHVDGELDLVHNLEVEQHLKSCANCTAEKQSLQSLRAALQKSNLSFRAPDSLRSDVRQFIDDLGAARNPRRASSFQWFWKFAAFGATAFALLAIFLRAPGLSDSDAFLGELVACHVRSLQAEHLTDVASSDQHTVKPWFDGKLDFAPEVRDFSAQNFPLVGGRLDYFQNRAVAALVYRHNKHLINVFIWPETGPQKAETTRLRGYSIISRSARGMRCCLISDLNAQEMNELADLIAK